jgi:ribosomal protein L11 methylase PrmA
LLRVYIDGVPLDLASSLLPGRTRWNLGLATHIHLHASAQKRYADASLEKARGGRKMSQQAMLGLIESLQSTVRALTWAPAGTEWADYYDATNYSEAAFTHKLNLVGEWLGNINPKMVWDLGANTGIFSRKAAELGAYTVSGDIDPAAVEQNYRQIKTAKEENILPLVLDLTNPSPAIGWQNQERESWVQRGPADAVLALAVVHHLAISNNVPLPRVAEFFSGMGQWLIVEFIPKTDSQVQKLLSSREDIFPDYRREAFEQVFQQWYEIQVSSDIRDSERRVYLMRRK